jgi:pimeloyl-ACP methyl ester carboxylesterase
VTKLTATVSHGQTFLTWVSPSGRGWVYHVYRATAPPDGSGIAPYELIGSVGDSTWYDRRCSTLLNWVHSYVLPDGTVLDPTQGLFVYTTSACATAWYAVTCDSAPAPEDLSLMPGSNATIAGVVETPDRPRPTRQRSVTVNGLTGDVYTLWTGDHDAPSFPAMCNRPSVPYDCAVVRGGPVGRQSLTFYPHVRGGNFLALTVGTGTPGEWVLTMDDFMPTAEGNTFWFGYNQGFDITAKSNPTPTSGDVVDYTMRRVIFTLEWARSTLPVDTTRVYAIGYSMGAIGAVFTALRRPDLIAGVMVAVGLFDFSFESDPNAACAFNVGRVQRQSCDHLWGTVPEDLPTPEGVHAFDLLSSNCLARMLAQAGQAVPPIVAFNGRYDSTTGWAEKPIFYRTMRQQREGGMFFFDNRTHAGGAPAAWAPMMGTFGYVHRYRSDRSFPAFSNCSLDSDPGDGRATSGDSVGTINGYLEWDTTTVVDHAYVWGTTLTLRSLSTRWATLPAPDSVLVDVTPRRLQSFKILPMRPVSYSLSYGSNGSVFRTGEALADANGVVTIPGVTVYRGGTRIAVWQFADATGVGELASSGLTLSGLANPLRGPCTFEVGWPRAGPGSVSVFDIQGRRVRSVISGPVSAGRQRARLDASTLAPGLYIVRARQGELTASRRVAVVR